MSTHSISGEKNTIIRTDYLILTIRKKIFKTSFLLVEINHKVYFTVSVHLSVSNFAKAI